MKHYETRTHRYRLWHRTEADSAEQASEIHFRDHADAGAELDGAACVEVRELYGDGTITRYHVERTVKVTPAAGPRASRTAANSDVQGWDGNGSPL